MASPFKSQGFIEKKQQKKGVKSNPKFFQPSQVVLANQTRGFSEVEFQLFDISIQSKH
jgi:hypothetical protein